MTTASTTLALLGPTNTGKTHRAIERMLEHDSGMIGLPLRLLAREVYDKVTARVGESRVALVTGEEQRVPPRPAYVIATVEAMPEKDVAFIAVDEVQLAAHPERGHVFTSRILHARGTAETWLLGAETMRPILRELVPTARHVEHPRLSRLSFAGAATLPRIPPRSAIVAFSMSHCYELAERLRARRGGCAVVLGALSPRTRNAQVAMFQAGDVDWLVATDAIGMGLNLDVDHVAFAAVRKFDGHEVREVEDAELAQIAGRAGRYTKDGTFGTLAPLELGADTALAIETHRFPAVRKVRWRNDDLDFGSVEALRASLAQPSPRPMLVLTRDAEDARALEILAERDLAKRVRGEEAVRLLWDVCAVPDFRKLLFEVHVDFLEHVYLELAARGRLSDDFVDGHVRELDTMEGDVETLVARIAATRTWTYLANRAQWLASPAEWQARTRDLEDRLSDALHAKLVARFVDDRRGRPKVRPQGKRPRPVPDESVRDVLEAARVSPDHPFAKLATLRAAMGPPPRAPVATDAKVEEIVEAPHAAFTLGRDGAIVHAPSGRRLAIVTAGPTIDRPDVRLVETVVDTRGARVRLHRRLLAFARDVVSEMLGNVRDLATRAASPEMRALVHRLERSLGTVWTADLDDIAGGWSEAERAALKEAGLHQGRRITWVEAGLGVEAIRARAALVCASGPLPLPKSIDDAPARFPWPRRKKQRAADGAALLAVGYVLVHGEAVRADVFDAASDATL